MSKHAVSKPNLLFGLILVVAIASMAVLADTLANNSSNQSVTSNQSQATGTDGGTTLADAAPQVTAASVQTVNIPLNLSTPMQAIQTCDQSAGCIQSGYIVNGNTLINTTGYNCSVADDGKTYLTCDSVYDGNGDGVCTSGETCVQFGIVGSFITRKERNSQDHWIENDPSFVMPTPPVQTLQ